METSQNAPAAVSGSPRGIDPTWASAPAVGGATGYRIDDLHQFARGGIRIVEGEPPSFVRLQWRQPFLPASVLKPLGIRGSLPCSVTLQPGHGIPAPPHGQACSPSQGLSGWFSQTQPLAPASHAGLGRRTMPFISGIVPPVPTAGIPFIAGKIVILAASVWWSAIALVPSMVSIVTACADIGRGRRHSHDGRVGRHSRHGNSSTDENGCCHRMNF